jgi:hypothetical protein
MILASLRSHPSRGEKSAVDFTFEYDSSWTSRDRTRGSRRRRHELELWSGRHRDQRSDTHGLRLVQKRCPRDNRNQRDTLSRRTSAGAQPAAEPVHSRSTPAVSRNGSVMKRPVHGRAAAPCRDGRQVVDRAATDPARHDRSRRWAWSVDSRSSTHSQVFPPHLRDLLKSRQVHSHVKLVHANL